MKKLFYIALISTPALAVEVEDISLDVKEIETSKDKVKNIPDENKNLQKEIKEQSEKIISLSNRKDKIENFNTSDSELLKLLVQTFLGNQDLENAYEVSKKALELFPNDPYWLKTFGQVSIWSKRPKEGLEAYLKLYDMTKDENLKKDIFNLAISVYRFDIAKQLIENDVKSGKFTDMQTVYYIYYQSGYINELIPILKVLYEKSKNKDALYFLTFTLYNLGKLQEALVYGKKLIEENEPNLKDIMLYSNILYSNRRFREALHVLKSYYDKIKKEIDKNLIKEYLSNLSDLAWALRDYDTAVKASEKLYKMNLAELKDYIRLYTYYFYKQKYTLSQKYAYEGYKIYKVKILLEGYIETLFRLEDFKKIVDFVDTEKIDISESVVVFSRYINSLIKIGKKEKAINIVLNILEKKFKVEFLLELIYISIDTSDQKLAKLILNKYSNYENEYKKEFGFLYYFLQNGKKALTLLSGLKFSKNYSDLIVYADLLNLYGKTSESDYLKYKIFRILDNKIKSGHYTDNELENYLKVAMQFIPSRQYTELLEIAKLKLNLQVYQEIINSYYLTIDNQNKIEYLIKMHNYSLRPWMKLNIALWSDDRYLQQKLLQKYVDILPIRDRVEALRRTGEINKAMYYGYKGLEENPDDYLLYKQQRDLIVQNKPKVEVKISYTERSNVSQITEDIYLSDYVAEGVKVFVKYKNSDIQSLGLGLVNLKNPQDYSFGIEKIFDDGKLTITFGILSTLNSNPYIDIVYSKYLTNRLNSGTEFGFNIPADDTLYLLYGGMKNKYSFNISYSVTNRLNYYINPSYNQYYSSDKVSIGNSFNLYQELYYKIRIGYPDYTFRIYTSQGYYKEKNGYKGSIEKISTFNNPKVLPSSFNQIGAGFLFGYENDTSLVRVVRPFMSIDLSYNDVTGIGYGFSGGIGGSIFRQDNLSLGFSYYKGFKGTTDKYFNTYLKYILFY